MKKIILLIMFVALSTAIFGQAASTITPDPKIYEVFTAEQIADWQQNNPAQIAYYNVLVQSGYRIEEYPEQKLATIDENPVFTLSSDFAGSKEDFTEEGLENINVLKYEISLYHNHINIYRLGNTTKIIVFLSSDDIDEMVQEMLRAN